VSESFEKAPADRLDYTVDFARWLPASDTISTAVSAITTIAGGNTAVIDTTDHDTTSARVWIASGVDGDEYEVDVTVTTTQGRIKRDCFRLRIKDCD
jgi:hypothetical protein